VIASTFFPLWARFRSDDNLELMTWSKTGHDGG